MNEATAPLPRAGGLFFALNVCYNDAVNTLRIMHSGGAHGQGKNRFRLYCLRL